MWESRKCGQGESVREKDKGEGRGGEGKVFPTLGYP